MKHFKILLMILSIQNYTHSQIKKQPNIQFETNFIQAVNHWVVFFQKPADPYLLGYIYLDPKVGFTFAAVGKLSFDRDAKYKFEPFPPNYLIKKLLEINAPAVFVLPQQMLVGLNLPEKPKWLQLYDHENDTAKSLMEEASFYSNAGSPVSAIPILQKALEKNDSSTEIMLRLACAYNSAAQYDDAISFCRKMRQRGILNYMLQRELGFALIQNGDFEEAENEYEITIPLCIEDQQRREMCLDMAQTFLKIGDSVKLEKWVSWTKKYASGDSLVLKYLDLFESEIRKKSEAEKYFFK